LSRAQRQIPIADGLFTGPPDAPQLVGSRCTRCREVSFPKQSSCPACTGDSTEEILLARRGKLWTWTIQRFPPPPPYIGDAERFEPYGVGYVELPEGVRVEARLTTADPERPRDRHGDGARAREVRRRPGRRGAHDLRLRAQTRTYGSFETLSPSVPVRISEGPTVRASRADGEQEAWIRAGETEIGGRLPVNTDGGLLANGEPIGASGLRQVHEICLQLRGEAGKRQVPGNPRTGYTHVYGFPGVSAVTVLSR
jgi:uncharacterized OB-fold protein